MNQITKLFLIIAATLISTLWFTQPTFATEGRFLLTSRFNENTKCLAFSVETKPSQFQILITCRGLVYPPQPPDLDNYILWADGAETSTPTKLTDLQFAKGYATMKTKFNHLYVTIESGSPKTPTGTIALEGYLGNYNFSNDTSPPTATPTTIQPTLTQDQPATDISQTPEEATTSSRTSFWSTTFGKIIIIVTAGFLIFIAIVVIYSRRG